MVTAYSDIENSRLTISAYNHAAREPATQREPERHKPLVERHFATVVRRLLDGIDQVVQRDRGREGRLAAFVAADRLSEERVHLADINGFA